MRQWTYEHLASPRSMSRIRDGFGTIWESNRKKFAGKVLFDHVFRACPKIKHNTRVMTLAKANALLGPNTDIQDTVLIKEASAGHDPRKGFFNGLDMSVGD
jgi:hypothetical protein